MAVPPADPPPPAASTMAARPPADPPLARAPGGPPEPPPAAGAGEGLLLARRVPQAHLAPELRRQPRAEAAAGADGPPDADQARDALSRYQASRQAARALVDEDRGPGGGAEPDHPGGGWS
jgi:hypothetical protein